ncbi:biotin--[acetyl-CoA-carboxylase] ligase [Kaistella flava (ex Peng et al. 2021)]|uniref:Biotin--[acetyl-CoA-carboxylase] ligase n=1 Tax=Kaistella flava (ex Peng et al. 2021) TaxID=2038776 RepID=A0A7M2YAW7_9FLAO|nr:biotin--[acetyl-CoA-carboxylase] ligase [Kaistella flava (ex Peng et al. 2021)]QOW10979.1 biotin--[acetyl-CoA-carboxylase] ligase [Kaistella flava (ex Peng et al. 2021)]
MMCLFYLKECSSTHDEIEKFISHDTLDLQAVCTFNQTKGKGQYGNSWESGNDLSLAYSVAVPDELIKLPNHLFNFHTAEVLTDFLAILTNHTPQIKWPNDIIINNKKVSGILIEKKIIKRRSYFLIGIGVNVLEENFKHLPKAGSLLTQTGIRFDLESLTESLHEYLVENLTKPTSEESVLKKLNERLFRKDLISVFQIGQSRQNGIIKKVDEDGFLWVELENDGLKKFFHKEIALLY